MTDIQSAAHRPLLAHIFLSPDERRLRAGWRLLLQTLLMVVLVFVVGLLFYISATIFRISADSMILSQLTEIVVITASVFLARRFLDRRSIADLGLKINRQALIDILAGIVITFIMMGAIYLGRDALGDAF